MYSSYKLKPGFIRHRSSDSTVSSTPSLSSTTSTASVSSGVITDSEAEERGTFENPIEISLDELSKNTLLQNIQPGTVLEMIKIADVEVLSQSKAYYQVQGRMHLVKPEDNSPYDGIFIVKLGEAGYDLYSSSTPTKFFEYWVPKSWLPDELLTEYYALTEELQIGGLAIGPEFAEFGESYDTKSSDYGVDEDDREWTYRGIDSDRAFGLAACGKKAKSKNWNNVGGKKL